MFATGTNPRHSIARARARRRRRDRRVRRRRRAGRPSVVRARRRAHWRTRRALHQRRHPGRRIDRGHAGRRLLTRSLRVNVKEPVAGAQGRDTSPSARRRGRAERIHQRPARHARHERLRGLEGRPSLSWLASPRPSWRRAACRVNVVSPGPTNSGIVEKLMGAEAAAAKRARARRRNSSRANGDHGGDRSRRRVSRQRRSVVHHGGGARRRRRHDTRLSALARSGRRRRWRAQ